MLELLALWGVHHRHGGHHVPTVCVGISARGLLLSSLRRLLLLGSRLRGLNSRSSGLRCSLRGLRVLSGSICGSGSGGTCGRTTGRRRRRVSTAIAVDISRRVPFLVLRARVCRYVVHRSGRVLALVVRRLSTLRALRGLLVLPVPRIILLV